MIERHGIPHEKCACGRVVHHEMMQEKDGKRVCDACYQRLRRQAKKSRREFDAQDT